MGKLIQFRLDEADPIDRCVLDALNPIPGSLNKNIKRMTQVFALTAAKHPAINIKVAQQQVLNEPIQEAGCLSFEPVAVATAEHAQDGTLSPIEVNYEDL